MADWILRAKARYPEQTFQKGDILIREGEPTPPLHVLLSGKVSVYRGDVRVNRVSALGAIFGEMSVLLGIPSSATVRAESDVTTIAIDQSEAFLASDPEVALHAARTLAQRLYDATTYLADLKVQFEDQSSHLGMVDQILGSLLNQQHETLEDSRGGSRDPRI